MSLLLLICTGGHSSDISLYIPLCLYYYDESTQKRLVNPATLHSTMSLLLRVNKFTTRASKSLYIPLCLYYYKFALFMTRVSLFFTFHYVSITTEQYQSIEHRLLSLHSTMSLLLLMDKLVLGRQNLLYIPLCLYYYASQMSTKPNTYIFTFHYVSITTKNK